MRRTVLHVVFALVLLLPSPSWSQPLQSCEHLALRLNLNDWVRVQDQSGHTAAGTLIRLSRDEMTIHTNAGDRRFTNDAVREVAVRGHGLRKGALIGTTVFAMLGAVASCAHEGGAGCAARGLLAAPIGAGVGLGMSAVIPRMTRICSAPAGREVPASVSSPFVDVQASLFDDLALLVNIDDHLRVTDQSGDRTTGRLTHLTDDSLTIETAAGARQFTRAALREVGLRRQPLRMAVLIGASAGLAAGAIAGCAGPDREECADAPIIVGGLGAGLGLAVGALIHNTTTVYPEARTRTRVTPAFSRQAASVRVSRWW